jgi:hypothetical protein
MGILDDAIREHLELKRRRGADPAEIERAEREALGPVRRRYDEPDARLSEAEPLDHEEAVPEERMEEAWHEAIPGAPPAGMHEPLSEDDEFDAPEPPARWEDEDPFRPADPAGAAPRPSDPSVHGLDAETSEYDVEAEHEAEEDDVLEETPDFLQDTPDHDRLWFEQRPPRDFDFDG